MKKRVVSFIISLLLIAVALPAYAAEKTDPLNCEFDIQPRLLTGLSASLSISDSQLKVYSSVICNNTNERIYLSVYLQRYKSGSWENYSTYTAQGTGDCILAKYVTPPKGYSYRLYAVASNSSLVTKYSNSVYF